MGTNNEESASPIYLQILRYDYYNWFLTCLFIVDFAPCIFKRYRAVEY